MTQIWLGTMVAPLLIVGVLLLALGFGKRERLLRVMGDIFVVSGLVMILVTALAVGGLEMNQISDFVVIIIVAVPAGLLAGDALSQALLKKSSSS